jgi:hypothetical protein
MKPRSFVSTILPLLGLVVVLVLGYGSVVLQKAIQQQASRYLDFLYVYLNIGSSAMAILVSTGLLLGMFWIVLRYSPKWIGIVYLVIGIILVVFPIGYFAILQTYPTTPYIPTFSDLIDKMVPISLLNMLAGGIGMTGFFKLFLRIRNTG